MSYSTQQDRSESVESSFALIYPLQLMTSCQQNLTCAHVDSLYPDSLSFSTLSAQSEEAGGAAGEVADRLGLAPSAIAVRVAAHGGEVRPRVLGNVTSAAAAHRA